MIKIKIIHTKYITANGITKTVIENQYWKKLIIKLFDRFKIKYQKKCELSYKFILATDNKILTIDKEKFEELFYNNVNNTNI